MFNDLTSAYVLYASYRNDPGYKNFPTLAYEKTIGLYPIETAEKCERLYNAGLTPICDRPSHFILLAQQVSWSVDRQIKEADAYLRIINR